MPREVLEDYHRKITDERFDKIDEKLDRLNRFMWVVIGVLIATSAWGGRVLDMAAAVAGGK